MLTVETILTAKRIRVAAKEDGEADTASKDDENNQEDSNEDSETDTHSENSEDKLDVDNEVEDR